MNMALEQAEKAYREDEVPIGALVVSAEGEVLSATHNQKEKVNDPCGHAELIAIRDAASKIDSWRLLDTTLYVTLEPCPMCIAAMVQSRISRLVFGAYDPKGGALSLGYDLYKDQRLNHNFSVMGGIEHFKCSKILSTFFKQKRKGHK
jgi:tRNA(adenine34) deaminase